MSFGGKEARPVLRGARSRRAWWLALAGAVFLVALCAACLVGQAQAAQANASKETLIDTYIAGTDQSCGVAVAVAMDGAQLHRDYGLEGGEGSSAVSQTTVFEWGRTSDLIVWACVMQLVEQGELELTAPLSTYLPEGVTLPDGYGSLDVLDLMNHASGLDVSMVGTASTLPDGTSDATAALSLFDVAAGFSPGSVVGYTPLDALLAAIVVQDVSGMDFAAYVQANVFERLGMSGTCLMVGGDATRFAQAGGLADAGLALAQGSSGPQSVSSPRTKTSSALTCVGTVDDLLKFGQALVGQPQGDAALFSDEGTVDTLFSVTRTYPSLGVARIAHGLFCFPFMTGVYGESGTTSSGFTCSLYMSPEDCTVVAVMANQSGRADLTQGVSRAIMGRADLSVEDSTTPDNYVWTGTYQSAGNAALGPSKLLTALDRVVVSVNEQGVMLIDGLTTTCLGSGVYSVDSAVDQDVYRFHVSLARGSEFSRVDEDYYIVSQATLVIEFGLLCFTASGGVFCAGYLLRGLATCAIGLRRRRRPRIQIAPLFLSVLTLAAQAGAVWGIYSLSVGMAPAALGVLLVAERVYCALSVACIAWMLVTRWRGSTWTRGQNVTVVLVTLASVALMLNLVYWDMLA